MISGKKLVEEYRKQIGKFTYAQMDCIRSIANILYRYGAKSEVTGSNWFARHEIVNLRQLTSKKQLYDGCAVLKTILPGEAGYDLDLRYKNHDVLIDYNHIGLGTDQGEILDSTTIMSGSTYIRNGPDVSTAPIGPRSWDVLGDFEDVSYTDEGGVPPVATKTAIVKAESGSTVNLRSRPSLNSMVLELIKVGSTVEVLDNADGDWRNIRTAQGNVGWIMIRYLNFDDPVTPEPGVPAGLTTAQITELREAIEHIQKVLGNG